MNTWHWRSFANRSHLLAAGQGVDGRPSLLVKRGGPGYPDRWLTACGTGPEIATTPERMTGTSPAECQPCWRLWAKAQAEATAATLRQEEVIE